MTRYYTRITPTATIAEVITQFDDSIAEAMLKIISPPQAITAPLSQERKELAVNSARLRGDCMGGLWPNTASNQSSSRLPSSSHLDSRGQALGSCRRQTTPGRRSHGGMGCPYPTAAQECSSTRRSLHHRSPGHTGSHNEPTRCTDLSTSIQGQTASGAGTSGHGQGKR